jgi:hypothetical protein
LSWRQFHNDEDHFSLNRRSPKFPFNFSNELKKSFFMIIIPSTSISFKHPFGP